MLLAIALAVTIAVSVRLRTAGPSLARLPGDDSVLATVNGSPVTSYEVEQAIDDSFGDLTKSQLGKEGRRKMLESLVSRRAIAQLEEAKLNPESRARLEKKVAEFREETLVNMYLKEYVKPEPVTPEMVKAYYEEHQDKWGGGATRSYEMLYAERLLVGGERDALIKALAEPGSQKDWKKWAEDLKKKKLPIAYREGIVLPKTLDARLVSLMSPLAVGAASNVSFIDGRAYVVRITNESNTASKPLAEVNQEIRSSLGPQQVKKAVKVASEEALKTAKVEYR